MTKTISGEEALRAIVTREGDMMELGDLLAKYAALIASQAARIRELEEAAGRLADRNCTYDTTGLFIPFDSHAQALAAMIDLRSLLSRKGGE
jgi:hypothetical protein